MPPSTKPDDAATDLVVGAYPDGELRCVWCGATWGDLAHLNGDEAARFSLDRAGGPWCLLHFRRHRFARTHQLTASSRFSR